MAHRSATPLPLDRRNLLKGAGVVALSATSLPALAKVLADPALAETAAAMTTTVETTTADGRTVQAAWILPEKAAGPVPVVLLIHEWWGLNDQIRTMAVECARLGYAALAVDLYDGAVATTPERAKELSSGVESDQAFATLDAWVGWLASQEAVAKTSGPEGNERPKMATMGWCFGGTWSLNASLAHPVDGTIVYYGKVNRPANELAALNGPVMGHFATQDKWITEQIVVEFSEAMVEADKLAEIYWYDADHAFANPTGNRYDADDASLAWDRTTAFLARTLKD